MQNDAWNFGQTGRLSVVQEVWLRLVLVRTLIGSWGLLRGFLGISAECSLCIVCNCVRRVQRGDLDAVYDARSMLWPCTARVDNQ
jgi:hypothetical protein